MSDPVEEIAGLESLLARLRGDLAIGPREEVWLRHAFSQVPPVDAHSLRVLLRVTLVKKEEQQLLFDAAFRDWIRDAESFVERPQAVAGPEGGAGTFGQALPPKTTMEQPTEPPRPASPPPLQGHPRRLALLAALAGALLGGSIYFAWREPERREVVLGPEPTPPANPVEEEPAQPESVDSDPVPISWPPTDPLAQYRGARLVDVSVIPPASRWSRFKNGSWLGWDLLATALAWHVLQLTLRARRRPPAEDGPKRLRLLPVPPKSVSWTPRDPRRGFIWNIERFRSQDSTPQLDLGSTVQATAEAAGVPIPHHEQAIYPREVWLWRDRSVHDPVVDRVLDELRDDLQRSGLPVRVGSFHSIPDRIQDDEGAIHQPLFMESHAQTCYAVLLTDGERLRGFLDSATMGGSIERLLQSLSMWPRLVLADTSDGAHGLPQLARRFGIRCISVNAIPEFLGGGDPAPATYRGPTPRLEGELAWWAATLALHDEPFDVDTALEVHASLRLKLPVQSGLSQLLAHCESLGGNRYRVPEPAERLRWLQGIQSRPGARPASSRLARSARYWIERYQKEWEERRRRHSKLSPFLGSPAEARLQLRQAVLRLWTDPEAASRQLGELAEGPLSTEVEQRLKELREAFESDAALPWAPASLPTAAHDTLARLGLVDKPRGLRWPSSTVLLVTAALLTFLVQAFWILWTEQHGQPQVSITGESLRHVVHEAHADPGHYDITLLTKRDALTLRRVPAGSRIEGTAQIGEGFSEEPSPNANATFLRCGSLTHPIRWDPQRAPLRTLAVLQASPEDTEARQLALRLLDLAIADGVWLGTDPPDEQQSDELWHDARIVIAQTPRDQEQIRQAWDRIAPAKRALEVEDKSIPSLLQILTWLSDDPETLPEKGPLGLAERWGLSPDDPGLRNWYRTEDQGDRQDPILVCGWTDLSAIPGGEFQMGSPETDEDPNYDEDLHPVVLSSFAMGRMEVTRGWYRHLVQEDRRWPEEWGSLPPNEVGRRPDDDLPANYVSWQDATAFLEALSVQQRLGAGIGFGLPTEAQWEYACRAGTRSLYWSGNDEADLLRVGWYRENSNQESDREPHPVAGKPANPFGLFDMTGNIFEWCQDWLGKYELNESGAPLQDPSGAAQGIGRVLRGGSFTGSANWCRSATRNGGPPVDRYEGAGFRVAFPQQDH